MPNKPITTPGSEAMRNLAEHYANELNAQFRTLNQFVKHAGEIGRVHEAFLRGILKRFLPSNISIGSGFIASPNWTSRQQDIIIYENQPPVLLKSGDCMVIDHESVVGTIEVKTKIANSKKLIETIEIQSELKKGIKQPALFAIYAWEGINYNTAIKAIWNYIRKETEFDYDILPDVIYMRGKYLLKMNNEKERNTYPYSVLHIRKNKVTEGDALLGLVTSLWDFSFNHPIPWWLLSQHEHLGLVAGKMKKVAWPNDLKNIKR